MTAINEPYKPRYGLKAYLAGPWSYLRLLVDRRLQAQGSILGICRFSPVGDDLSYDERGHLTFAGTRTITTRRYRYSFPDDHSAHVFFHDKRHFHDMTLAAGEDRFQHHCPPDHYQGRCRLLTEASWRLEWRVSGPRKDLTLTTHYLRFKDGLDCFGIGSLPHPGQGHSQSTD